MKKFITVSIIVFLSIQGHAQERFEPFANKGFMEEMGRTFSIILLFALIMGFIITMTRLILDHRVKRKMIDKGISEELAAKVLQTGKNTKNEALKWFLILLSIGSGFLIVSLFQPIGFHSIAIMAFTIAIGFMVYYFLIPRQK